MARKSFSYSEVLGFGWSVMKSNFLFFLGVIVVSTLTSSSSRILGEVMKRYPGAIAPFWFFVLLGVSFIIQIIVGIGQTKIALSFCDDKKPKFSTLFNAWDCFWRYVVAGLLYVLIIFGICMALAVALRLPLPALFELLLILAITILAVILSYKFILCFYFVVDKGVGPIKALRASSRATRGAKSSLFVFFLLCGLINLAGALCLLVGLFASVPTVMVAMALVYRQLAEQTPELAKLGIGGHAAPSAVVAGMQFNPIIPSIHSGSSILPSGGAHPSQSAPPSAAIRPAPNIRREREKINSNSLPWWVVVSGVCVAIAAGLSYYFLVMAKGSSPNKVAASLKNAAVSLKDAAISSNKVALKGILYSEDNSSAMVGNKIVKEGDIIDGIKVVKISKDTVEFEKDGQRWTQRTK